MVNIDKPNFYRTIFMVRSTPSRLAIQLHLKYEKMSHFSWPYSWMEALKNVQKDSPLTSDFQKDIMRILQMNQKGFIEEFSIQDLLIDMTMPDLKIAVEGDGPSHYADQSQMPLGKLC